MFSLNFSSAGKGPFMAGKAGERGGGVQWSEGPGPTLGGAKFFELSFPRFIKRPHLFYGNRPFCYL